MSYALALNSTNVTGPTNSVLQYTFVNGSFVAKNAEIALSSASIPYSWYNVSSNYNNQSFSLEFPVGSSTTTLNITLPAGYYDVTDIQEYIQQQCIANNLYLVDNAGNYVYYVYMSYNVNYYKIQVLLTSVPSTLPSGWSKPTAGTGGWATALPSFGFVPRLILPATGSISTIIGFAAGASYPIGITNVSQSILSTLTPNGSTVNSIVCRCSIVRNDIGSPTDILDAINISVPYGSAITYEPSFERWVKINDGTYSNITLTLCDQNFNTIYALDPNISITLLIRNRNN
jgi:hypothetical protein